MYGQDSRGEIETRRVSTSEMVVDRKWRARLTPDSVISSGQGAVSVVHCCRRHIAISLTLHQESGVVITGIQCWSHDTSRSRYNKCSMFNANMKLHIQMLIYLRTETTICFMLIQTRAVFDFQIINWVNDRDN